MTIGIVYIAKIATLIDATMTKGEPLLIKICWLGCVASAGIGTVIWVREMLKELNKKKER